MKRTHSLTSSASVLALAAAATFASATVQPAAAGADTGSIYGGGSSLFSVAARALFNSYHGAALSSSDLAPFTVGTSPVQSNVFGLYASVGSGSGLRAFVDDDTHELLPGGSSPFALPAVPPVYVDGTNAGNNGVYPYFESTYHPNYNLDFAASDSPLGATLTAASFTGWTPASGWQNQSSITASAGPGVTYSTANYGNPIQIPFGEVAVAIGVNIPYTNTGTWQVKTQTTQTDTASGKTINTPIHLNQAQLCAIFAGAVTNWNDTSTSITYLDSSGTKQSKLFSGFNTPGAVAYNSASTPIKLFYRSDKSGTTFIVTNFLHAVCPALDNGSNHYTAIFGSSNLPTTDFSGVFLPLVTAAGGNTTNWAGAQLTSGVASAIASTTGGFGYISNDFTNAYNSSGPLAAAVSDEDNRTAGIYTPSSATPFIAPTIGSTKLGWSSLAAPTTATYSAWNVYALVHTVSPYGSVSALATPTAAGAYPISGTTFLFAYSCYKQQNRATVLADFLGWLYNGSFTGSGGNPQEGRNANISGGSFVAKPDGAVASTLAKNGFAPLSTSWATAALKTYVNSTTLAGANNTSAISYGGSSTVGSCSSVSGS